MPFCTAINCMDGRVQLPVIEYLKDQYNADYVDMITEAGPITILSDKEKGQQIDSIISRAEISVNIHGSKLIAIVAHYDCAGDPLDKAKQLVQLEDSVKLIKQKFPETQILGLWVDKHWIVNEIIPFEGNKFPRINP